MERTASTFERGLILAAMIVVVATMGLLLLAPTLDALDITVPAAKTQATEQEMEQAWENLEDAIHREDQAEALRIAEWLDEQHEHDLKEGATEVVRNWCKHKGLDWEFCEEEDNEAK